jgi:hypothetical protein
MSTPKAEAHAPLIIYADAPLPLPVTGKFFQPVIGRYAQIIKSNRPMKHLQLPLSYGANVH